MKTPKYIKDMAKELATHLTIIEYGQLATEMQKPRVRRLNQIQKDLGVLNG